MKCNECFVDRCIDTEYLVQTDESEGTTGGRTVRDHGKPGCAAELLMRRRQQGHAGGREKSHITEIDHHSRRRFLEYESDRLGQIGSSHQIQFTGYRQNHVLVTPFHDHIEVLGPEARVVRSHTPTLPRPTLADLLPLGRVARLPLGSLR
jgi:hypothetical protein